jgi:hypothetical protein
METIKFMGSGNAILGTEVTKNNNGVEHLRRAKADHNIYGESLDENTKTINKINQDLMRKFCKDNGLKFTTARY